MPRGNQRKKDRRRAQAGGDKGSKNKDDVMAKNADEIAGAAGGTSSGEAKGIKHNVSRMSNGNGAAKPENKPARIDVMGKETGELEQVQVAREEKEVKEKPAVEDEESSLNHLNGLFLYCSLFPSDFEFKKQDLVQLWIAEGFDMKQSDKETMEDAGIKHFNSLESKGYFVRSRSDFELDFDSVCSVPIYSPEVYFYKVHSVRLSELENKGCRAEYLRAVNGKLVEAYESTIQHLSLTCDDIDEMTFEVLSKFKNLRTLLFFPGKGSSTPIKSVPNDLFLSLSLLTTLTLSRTLISGLPNSVGNIKPLQYLDVSYTLIDWLPESICSLDNLQTLKLRGCEHLNDLPRRLHLLSALRHLEFDIIRQLDAMPDHMGKLTKLQTLSAFLVDKYEGRRIRELENLNDLGGVLRILRLENVLNKEDAEDAKLPEKKHLQRLDLRWTTVLAKNIKLQEEVLNALKPHPGLQELQIVFYNGTKFPAWLSSPLFTGLVVLTLFRCENCEILPSLGQLPNLKFLSMVEMKEVKEINQAFFGNVDDSPHKKVCAFPQLEELEIDSMPNLKEWKEVKEGDLPSLIKLSMESCPELVTLPSFAHLKRLKYMELSNCQQLLPLDPNGLPASLELITSDC